MILKELVRVNDEKQVLFQGTGYRILANDKYNVVLQLQNESKRYVFVGYYSTIQMALKELVRRDMLMNRYVTQDVKSYMKEIITYKNQLMADIDAHFSIDEELFN